MSRGCRQVRRETSRLAPLAALGWWLLAALPCLAAEPSIEFLTGLRAAGYYDTAQQYLDLLAEQPKTPAVVRDVLAYERGLVLLAAATDPLAGPDAQRQRLQSAQQAFDEFTRAHPGHPLAPRANAERGRILLTRARVDLWDSEKLDQPAEKSAARIALRDNLANARKIFLESQMQSQQALLVFPSPIPENDKAKLAERSAVENQLLSAGLDAIQCLYLQAQSYDAGSSQRKDLLTQAAGEFEKFRQEHRSTLAGLYAAVWQGKCFEEQGDTRTSIGLYQEVLANVRADDSNGSALRLRDLAFRNLLICLNHESQQKSGDAVLRAEEWLKTARERTRTEEGVGIQWELARAHEKLAGQAGQPENQRQSHLTQALNASRTVARFPGEFKHPAAQMVQRVTLALGRKADEPTDFDTAFAAAGRVYDQISELKEALQKSQAAGRRDETRQQLATQAAAAAEMTRLDEIALRLATPATDVAQVNTSWLRLSYGYVLQKRSLDATALADFLISKFAESSPELALEAGFIGATALQESARDLGAGELDFEIRLAERLCQQLEAKWPESDRTHDCRNVLARLQLQQGDALAAAKTWSNVPASSPRYASTQVRAGLAMWKNYVEQVSRPADTRPAETQLNVWKTQAIEFLERGVTSGEKQLADSAALPADLLQGKLTLAGIRNVDGIYTAQPNGPPGALELLTAGPHAVIAAVTVEPGQARPTAPEDPRSRQTANLAYRQLLRTQIGLRNLEAARAARAKLEEVAGADDEASLTEVFVQFGQQLHEELAQLRDSGQTQRLQDVRAGFEAFLNDLFQRNEGQTFASLLWIAETYTSLASSIADQPDKAGAFFNKAASAYQSILDQSAAKADFASSSQIVACKLRLVNCLRQQQSFLKAEAVLREVLAVYPQAPNVQMEAAHLYQDWGAAGGEESTARFNIAIAGQKSTPALWGWAYTAQAIRRALQTKADPQLEQMHFDARFHHAEAERAFSKSQKDPAAARDHLQRALNVIVSFQRTSSRWPDAEYERFNQLYQSLQRDLKVSPVALPREFNPATANAVAQNGGAPVTAPPAVPAIPNPVVDPVPAAEPKPSGTGTNVLGIGLVLLLGVGVVGAIIWYGGRKPGRSRGTGTRKRASSAKPKINLDADVFPGLPEEKKPAPRTAAKPAARPTSRPASPLPPGTAPPVARKPTREGPPGKP